MNTVIKKACKVGLGALLVTTLASAAFAQTVNLRVASYAPEGDVIDNALTRLHEELMERTDGEFGLTVFRSNSLGSIRESIELTQRGSVDMTVSGAPHLSRFAPVVGVTSFPYIWKSRDAMTDILNGDIGDSIAAIAEEQAEGLKVLSWWVTGFRHVTNNVRPILSPDDIKGLKLRVVPTPVQIAFWTKLGAIPTPMDWAEVMPSLQQNVIDGQENPPSVVYPYRVFEFQKYYSLTRHGNEPTLLLMSKSSHEGLSDAHKTALSDALKAVLPYEYAIADEDDTVLLTKLGEVIEVNEVPQETLDNFRSVALSIYEAGLETLGTDQAASLVDQIANF